jgi:hypothetical protein
MAAVWAWFQLDLRRQWRSLLVLALLVAIASGTVMAATAGARRADSSMDRLLAETFPATVLVAPLTPGFDWEAVRALPEVEALTEIVFSPYEVDGRPAPDWMMLPPGDAEAMSSIERPVVLDGRLADPTRSDEVVVTPAFVATSGKGVGDTVDLRLFTPEQVDKAQIPAQVPTILTSPVWILTTEQMEAAVLSSGAEIQEINRAAGPVVEATIVGEVRSPWFGDRVDSGGYVIPSPGLYAEYGANLLGAEGLASVNALIRLDGGEAAISALQAGLAGIAERPDIDVWNLVTPAQRTRDVIGFEATSLAIFAAVAGVAGAVLIGLAMARYAASTVTELRALRAVGMTPRQARLAAALGPTLAAIAGTAVGGSGAIFASRWFPIGSAAVVEPNPGVDVDLVVLLAGLLGVPLLVAGAAAAAGPALRPAGRATSDRPSTIASAGARASLPIPAVLGIRFALESGRDQRAVPVRSVLVGAVSGVACVMAALIFSSAVGDAIANPARVGVLYQFEAWAGADNFEFWQAEQGFAAVADTPGIAGVNDTRAQVAHAGGVQVTVFSLDPLGAAPDYVITEGRLPGASTEILLGRRSADALRAELGDAVALAGSSGEVNFTVVGVGFVDFVGTLLGNADPAGAATTKEGYEALFADEFVIRYGQVQLEPGVGIEMGLSRLNDAMGALPEMGYSPEWIVPTEDREIPAELRSVQTLPVILAGFLTLLALGAVGHALATAVRRRRYDIAVLRALGMTRRQSRSTVIVQATVLALVGLLIGVPLGVALGRTVWRYVADVSSVHYVPPAVWLALLSTVVVTLVAANLLAALPGRRAATLRIAAVLRAE